MEFWICMAAATAGVISALVAVYIEYHPMVAEHEESARQAWNCYYDVKSELEAERKSRLQAQEQIMVLSKQVVEAEKERKIVCKRLEGQFRENSKLKKSMRRKKKPVMRNGGRGKKRCMKEVAA